MGYGLRDVAINAGQIQQGMNDERRQGVADASARLGLERDRIATDEIRRQSQAADEARAATSKSWDDAKTAAATANAGIRAGNEPEVITTPASDLAPETTVYRNRQTGKIHDTPDAARGVVPEKLPESIWEREFASKVRDVYMKNGMPDKAAALEDWVQSQSGKRYLNEAHRGLAALAQGDKAGGLSILQDLYNRQIQDGRYASYEDLGNGSTKITITDKKTGQASSAVVPDNELGLRAAQSFLSPQTLATHVLATDAATKKLTAQFNVDVAKERIKAALHDNSKAQEIALGARAKMLEQVNQTQLDAMIGKGAHVTMDQLGQNIIVTVPGQGVYKLDNKGAMIPVANGSFKLPPNAVIMQLADFAGSSTAAPGVGVRTSAPATPDAAAPAAPAAPAGKKVVPLQVAVQRMKDAAMGGQLTPQDKAEFEKLYPGEKADKYLGGAGIKVIPPSAPPVAAPAPAPVPAPDASAVPVSTDAAPPVAPAAPAPVPAPVAAPVAKPKKSAIETQTEQLASAVKEARDRLQAIGSRQKKADPGIVERTQRELAQLEKAYNAAQAEYERSVGGEKRRGVGGRVLKP